METRSTATEFSCANCEFGIAGRPTIHVGVAFCCAGCAAGGPCSCTYDEPFIAERPRVHECLDVTALGNRDRAVPVLALSHR